MPTLRTCTTPNQDFRIQDFPALASLQLNNEDLQRLSQQGFLSRETRRGRDYFKLRFRRSGRQRVKYVRAGQAAAVRAELDGLQIAIRFNRNLAAVTRHAREALRQSKRNLQPLLAARGLAFHGLAIRRPRGPKPNDLQSPTQPTR